MATTYSPELVKELVGKFHSTHVDRPLRVGRYEAGTELTYDITGVAPASSAQMRVKVERFVGGGFAGQVYRVELLELTSPVGDLQVGEHYAVKILIPPSGFAQRFRDVLYGIGYQAPFSLQSNPAAARAGVLWQTLIRRAAKIRFGDERAVTEVHATFVDDTLGSCGEISEWIDGRVWRFEVDDHLEHRRRWRLGEPIEGYGSPEYLAKKRFMAELVKMLHEMGAGELARQYEWWTCKSQPNCLKRLDAEGDPGAGLTAVDFRAGLTLLPVLPMSPADLWLIVRGLSRGKLVQFDRGDVAKLQQFIADHREHFEDLTGCVEELTAAEDQYKSSEIDVTHNLPRLVTSPKLWGGIFDATAESWRTRNLTDDGAHRVFGKSRLATAAMALWNLLSPASIIAGLAVLLTCLFRWQITWTEGLIGGGLLLVAPKVVRCVRTFIGRGDLRSHYGKVLINPLYLLRAIRAHIIERTIEWHRAGRIDERYARGLMRHPWLYVVHLPFSLLPMAFLHRLLTDPLYIVGVFNYIVISPARLLFNAELREGWMRQMLEDGRRRHMLTDAEAKEVDDHIADPFIQKYIKSLAVHVCTLPISQVVALIVAVIYAWQKGLHFWHDFWEVWAIAVAAIAIVQVVPISPGSLVRGLYVVYLGVRERSFKNYNIAVFLGFFKYIGYLAFPIQMAYRYATLARFMAGHWATGAVGHIPVFGERGALVEHAVFDMFFNYPMTLRRRSRTRTERRKTQRPIGFHWPLVAILTVALYSAIAWVLVRDSALPSQRTIWYATIFVPLLGGWLIARLAGGAPTRRRIFMGLFGGLLAGLLQGAAHTAMTHQLIADGGGLWGSDMLGLFGRAAAWRMFTFSIFATIGAVICETFAPESKAASS